MTSDANLGLRIHKLLCAHNLENPVDFNRVANWHEAGNLSLLVNRYADLLTDFGLVVPADAAHAAKRLVSFYTQERFSGLNYRNFPAISPIANEFNYQQPLIAEGIVLRTTCEHHLLPITGQVCLAYQPHKVLVGLNKLNQIVDFFARRPQLQERLTRQLAVVMAEVVASPDVAVIIKARHDCMATGNSPDEQTYHTTYQLEGVFASDQALKARLLTVS